MRKAEREALRKRVCSWKWSDVYNVGRLVDLVASEIDRERRRARKHVFCLDCGGEVINEPVLCEECVGRRDAEGMSREDKRKISTWRRT